MSHKVEVLVDGDTSWVSNALRFETTEEAESYGKDLFRRWLAVKEWRIADSDEPVNYRINNGSSTI